MNGTLALTLVLVAQDPTPPPPAPEYVVHLKSGGELTGTLELETKDYVELRIDGSHVVGFQRSRIERIERLERPAVEPQAPAALTNRDDWFVLQDADGAAAGSLHCTVTPGDDGQLRIGEEWRFTKTDGATEITRLETVDGALRPLVCFYHERVRDRAENVVSERVVRATMTQGGLLIERRSMSGSQRRTLPVTGEVRFPLSWRERLLQRPNERRTEAALLYDAATDELTRWSLGAERRRRVPHGAGSLAVSELTWKNAGNGSADWVDASARVVRREVNGSDLVAWPATEAQARSGLVPKVGAARVVEPEGAFALRLPNPVWRGIDPQRKGQVSAQATLHQASATLLRLDHLQNGLALPSIADSVERWLALAKPDFDVQSREATTVRGRAALALHARFTVEGVKHRCVVHVFQGATAPMALCVSAPAAECELLAADFIRILEGVELDPQDLAPRLQGPLADQTTGKRRS